MTSPTRWGICSAGKISHDFVGGIKALDPKEHQVVAVAAQNLNRAEQFAKTNNIPTAYGDYAKLAQDPNVDVVYIGAIHPAHYNLCIMMFAAKKHVLCEKPLTMNQKMTQELINKAKENNVFLMEASWTQFLPSVRDMVRRIDEGEIGDVRFCSATFGVPISDVPRIRDKELGGGVLLDIGYYIFMFANLIFKGEKPDKVVATGSFNDTGIEQSVSVTLHYSGGRMAYLFCTGVVHMDNFATVSGTKGFLKVASPFWCTTSLDAPSGHHDYPMPEVDHTFVYENSAGLNYEAQHVRECLLAGKLESDINPHATTLNIMGILDEARRQIGVTHDL